MNCLTKQTVLNNILSLEKHREKNAKSTNRNILNKWFQDNTKSFHMRAIAGELLYKPLNMQSTEEVQSYVNSNSNPELPIFIGCIIKYFELIVEMGLENEFLKKLMNQIENIDKEVQTHELQDYNVRKQIRQSFVSTLLYSFFLKYTDDPDYAQTFNSFFDIWDQAFPEHPITQKRKNIFQMKKLQKMEASPMRKTPKPRKHAQKSNNYPTVSSLQSQQAENFLPNIAEDQQIEGDRQNETTTFIKSNSIDLNERNEVDGEQQESNSEENKEMNDDNGYPTNNYLLQNEGQYEFEHDQEESKYLNSVSNIFMSNHQMEEDNSLFVEVSPDRVEDFFSNHQQIPNFDFMNMEPNHDYSWKDQQNIPFQGESAINFEFNVEDNFPHTFRLQEQQQSYDNFNFLEQQNYQQTNNQYGQDSSYFTQYQQFEYKFSNLSIDNQEQEVYSQQNQHTI